MLVLRDYQDQLKAKVYAAWACGFRNVLVVLPTGMGKTKTFCSITIDKAIASAMVAAIDPAMPTVIMVHRKELVQQICITLAEEDIPHNIVAPRNVIKGIIASERRALGRQFYNPHANVSVISVDTLNARAKKYEDWAKKIRLWITDEAAHLLRENKWGKAAQLFPNAIGLGVTATPERLDKKGLGSHVDGLFDTMIEGPTTRWGIDNGYLCKYKIAIPNSDYQDYLQKASSGSDYSKKAMADAARKSKIVGDVVENYQKFANGKQAILFASDIKTANEMEKEFNDKGISAKNLTGETPDQERLEALLDFASGKIKVLINVDLFDEGLDVPGIECVIMARPTMSLAKFLQMVGRGLRPVYADGYNLKTVEGRLTAQANGTKPYLTLIDHVGNVMTHGLPCEVRRWTLDRVAKKKDKINFIRICSNIECNSPYDRALTECPWCGTPAIIASRAGGGGRIPPEKVDGDLSLIDPETIRELEAQTYLEDPAETARRVGQAAGGAAGLKAMKNQRERIDKQNELSSAIARWAGVLKNRYGYTDRNIHKRFYMSQGMTITEALAEPKADMQNTIFQLEGEF